MKRIITPIILIMLVVACSKKEDHSEVMTQYLAIKDALVLTDPIATKAAATKFLEVNTNATLKADLQMITSSNDIEVQRRAFEGLSMKVYDMLKRRGSDTVLYKQYCPMAFNNKGAFWLAAEMEVNNPYFGDVMLHCGSVQEKIGG